MKNKTFLYAATLLFTLGPAYGELSHVAVINDSDGYTNIRRSKGANTEIVGKIEDGVRFLVEPSAETWWQVASPDGKRGYMHRDFIRVLSAAQINSSNISTATVPSGASFVRQQPNSISGTHAELLTGHFSPGIPAPGPTSSDTEYFLYEMHGIAMSYFLATSYHKAYGNDVMTDAHWALGRGLAIEELVGSVGDETPVELVQFCQEALELDRFLQNLARVSENFGQNTINDARDRFIGREGDFSRNESVTENFFGLLLESTTRMQNFNEMARTLLRRKQEEDYHQRWSLLLRDLAKKDPGIRPYAAVPHFTDPTWHFLRDETMGDSYRGETVATRGPKQFSLSRPTLRLHIGNLGDGPILVRMNRKGSFICEISVDLPPGTGPITQAECENGHFGFQVDSTSTWVARGLSDFQHSGRVDATPTRNWINGGQATIHVFHLATGAGGEDEVSEGSLVIYRKGQALSDIEARRLARVVNL